jgi:hypothetical protein
VLQLPNFQLSHSVEQLVQKRAQLTDLCLDLEREEEAQARKLKLDDERRVHGSSSSMRKSADKSGLTGLGGGIILAASGSGVGAVTRASAKREHPDKNFGASLTDSGKKKKRRAI